MEVFLFIGVYLFYVWTYYTLTYDEFKKMGIIDNSFKFYLWLLVISPIVMLWVILYNTYQRINEMRKR